jgi:prophage regulatory protein
MAAEAPQLPQSADRLLRLPEVRALTSMSTAHIYQAMSEGAFPCNVKIGRQAVAWRKSAIDAWMAALLGNPIYAAAAQKHEAMDGAL